jgi:uncharacterized protein
MKTLFRTDDLRFDPRITIFTIASTLLILLDYYNNFTGSKPVDRLILFLIIPLLLIFAFRDNPRDYGFRLGDWKAGIALTLGSIILIAPILYWLARGDDSMRAYYAWQSGGQMLWDTFLSLLGWEFMFRGWILFAYARKFGPDALWLQAVPFAIAHISKPQVETLSTIFGGFVFGWVAWRTNSFLYPFLIHLFVSAFTILAAAGLLG